MRKRRERLKIHGIRYDREASLVYSVQAADYAKWVRSRGFLARVIPRKKKLGTTFDIYTGRRRKR